MSRLQRAALAPRRCLRAPSPLVSVLLVGLGAIASSWIQSISGNLGLRGAHAAGAGGSSTGSLPALQMLGRVSQTFTEAVGLSIAERCEVDHAAALGEQFYHMNNGTAYTACHTAAWMATLQQLEPGGKRWLVDIGCNKGYTSAHMFALWAPELGFNPQSLFQWKDSLGCGSCGDCQEQTVSLVQPPADRDLQVICVEPNLETFAGLVATRQHFVNSSVRGAQWHLVLAAISNPDAATSHASFPRCVLGDEECGLSEEGGDEPLKETPASGQLKAFDLVPLRSVDALLDAYGVEHLDVLKIDTEGFDPMALAGATGSLVSRRVSVVQFEYHNKGVWHHYTLQEIVARMNGLGMTCYFSGKDFKEGSLVRLTGCWSKRFEFYNNANVVCVLREHGLYPHVERMSTRYNMFRTAYFANDTQPGPEPPKLDERGIAVKTAARR